MSFDWILAKRLVPAATVVDADQALTAGIGKEEASRLLINGFADQVMDDLDNEVVRAWITKRLGHDHA